MPVPKTPKKPTTEILHGHKIKDDYRWLEDIKDNKVQDWVNNQNFYTDEVFGESTELGIWKKQAERYSHFETKGIPTIRGDKIFYYYQGAEDDLPKIFVENNNGGNRKVLIDASKLSKDGLAHLGNWSVSNSGKLLAYSYSVGGDEINSLHILDVDTGSELPDVVSNFGWGGVRWLDDDSGFFYAKGPNKGEVSDDELRLHEKVYLHKLGESIESDKMIFGDGRPKDDMYSLSRMYGSRYLAISVSREWTQNDTYLYDIKSGKISDFIIGKKAHFSVKPTKGGIFISTNYKAKNKKILFVTLDKIDNPLDESNVLIPEKKVLIDYYCLTKSRIVVGYTKDATDYAEIYDYDGQYIDRLPTPEVASVGVFSSIRRDDVYYGVVTPQNPRITYKFNVVTFEKELYFEVKMPHNPDDYETKREWAVSKDGTKLPVFITKRKDIKKPSPTILYGYGGFGVPVGATYFLGRYMSWVEAGGVFVNAVIRGGGEYGLSWHKDGIKYKKQSSYDDFIAIAEFLVENDYTTKEQLSIFGASNGGLLVGAVMTQRPDLFKAVISGVPLLDMVHFHKLLIAGRWVHEYGDPDNKKEFNSLIKWSPYHNINPDKRYPALFLTTAENDTRVHPMHALKMTALLQNIKYPNTVLLRVEKDLGHVSANTRSKQLESYSEKLAFLGWQLGLKPK